MAPQGTEERTERAFVLSIENESNDAHALLDEMVDARVGWQPGVRGAGLTRTPLLTFQSHAMPSWLPAAIDIPRWIEFQMRLFEQPGCVIAMAHQRHIALEAAFGSADLRSGAPLTAHHRFRVASQSKTFTAAGIMKLRERGAVGLDDKVARTCRGSTRRSRRRP